MEITIETRDEEAELGCNYVDAHCFRKVHNEEGSTKNITWFDALHTFFEALRGVGYDFICDPKEFEEAVYEVHKAHGGI